MRRSIFAVLAVTILAGCAAPGGRGHEFRTGRNQAKTICEIMARPDAFAGRRLTVRGLYEVTPHQRVLVDRNCGQWEFAVDLHTSVRSREPARGTRVIYSGVFTSSRQVSPCSEPECFKYSLKNSRLVGTY